MINVFEDFASRQAGGGALVVTRRPTGEPAYRDGYPAPNGEPQLIPIVAQVVPVDGRGLKVLGDRAETSESLMLFTATKLVSRTATTEPDQVQGFDLDDGEDSIWTVFNVQKWTAPDTDQFYKVIITRDKPQ